MVKLIEKSGKNAIIPCCTPALHATPNILHFPTTLSRWNSILANFMQTIYQNISKIWQLGELFCFAPYHVDVHFCIDICAPTCNELPFLFRNKQHKLWFSAFSHH